jgi:hypothetical protein
MLHPRELLKKFTEQGGTKKAELVEFAPITVNPKTVRATQVHMIASVGGKFNDNDPSRRWELVGGTDPWVSPELADKLIVNGWAAGTLSREWSEQEIAEERAKSQHLIVGSVNG